MPNTFLDGSNVSLAVAFLAGLISFFASCLLPLVPTYLAYLSGLSLATVDDTKSRLRLIGAASFFVAGFVLAFMIVGLSLNQLASPLHQWRVVVERIAGSLFIILGLFMLGIFRSNLLLSEHRPAWSATFSRLLGGKFAKSFSQTNQVIKKSWPVHAFLVGFGFAFGWSPCIGPVLAVILYWSSQAATAWQGAALLAVYGLGLGLPFILVAALFELIMPILRRSVVFSQLIMKVAALVIIISGILLILGQFSNFSMTIFNGLGLDPRGF